MKRNVSYMLLVVTFAFCFECKHAGSSRISANEDLSDITSNKLVTSDDVRNAFYSIENAENGQLENLSIGEMNILFQNAVNHPVAKLSKENIKKYDPDGIIGFCFGRAMTVHLLARKMGVSSTSLKKMFVIGDLRSGKDPEWRFHVTTLVKNEKGEWFAVDPIMKGPMDVRDWIKTVQKVWDSWQNGIHNAKFYLVTTDAVIPDLSVFVAPENEKGEHIIEIKFDPATKEGFTLNPEVSEKAYNVSLNSEKKYFSAVTEEESTKFDFLKVVINTTDHIVFNNYFVDLLTDLTNTREEPNPSLLVSPLEVGNSKGITAESIEDSEPIDLFHPNYVEAYMKEKK